MAQQDTATETDRPSTNGHGGDQVDRRLLIDGRLVTTDKTFPSYNPATGTLIGYAPDASAADAEAAIAAALARSTPPTGRRTSTCGSAASSSCTGRWSSTATSLPS